MPERYVRFFWLLVALTWFALIAALVNAGFTPDYWLLHHLEGAELPYPTSTVIVFALLGTVELVVAALIVRPWKLKRLWLRLLIAFSKATANLERMGDEAHKMARMVKSIIESGAARSLPTGDLRTAAEMASGLLRKTLDAFARLDTKAAVAILKEDDLIDQEFDGFVRKLITYMMEDPRTISASLDLLFLAKAIERIGDHSKNVAELIIYLVEGKDVRHQTMDAIESAVL